MTTSVATSAWVAPHVAQRESVVAAAAAAMN